VFFLDPVPSGKVVSFLRSADIGLIPVLSFPSHEMALPNKVFEYLYAELPLVSSDLMTLGPFVRDYGIGEVFRPGDALGLARAVRSVLSRIEHYRENVRNPEMLDQYSWGRQQEELRKVYEDLLGTTLEGPLAAPGIIDLSESPVDVGVKP
jgi:glycosyltransferase involved in cell wall biosynthesis